MKTISKRDLSRKPSLLSALQPGESLRVEDSAGGLTVTRAKGRRPSPEEMEAQIEELSGNAPKLDTLAFLQQGEA